MKYTKTFLKQAHKKTRNNKQEIKDSSMCGCFHCKRIFSSTKIKHWFAERPGGKKSSNTAACPYCRIDSVISNASGLPLCETFIEAMEKYWFGNVKVLK